MLNISEVSKIEVGDEVILRNLPSGKLEKKYPEFFSNSLQEEIEEKYSTPEALTYPKDWEGKSAIVTRLDLVAYNMDLQFLHKPNWETYHFTVAVGIAIDDRGKEARYAKPEGYCYKKVYKPEIEGVKDLLDHWK